MKQIINQLYSLSKKYPTRITKDSELQALLNRIRPMKTDKELIRIGAEGDGGYLVPNDLENISACFSPGVDYTSVFEKDCAALGMDVFMADHSVEGPADEHEKFLFVKKYLGIIGDDISITLDDWVRTSVADPDAEFILQMDIEGAEYEVLLGATEDLLNRFRIIIIEFHSLKTLWSKPFFSLASRAFDKLLQTHVCVHNHPNNINSSKKIGSIEMPSVTEMTFLRNDRINESSYASTFPHPLDSDNSGKRSMDLPECWYE